MHACTYIHVHTIWAAWEEEEREDVLEAAAREVRVEGRGVEAAVLRLVRRAPCVACLARDDARLGAGQGQGEGQGWRQGEGEGCGQGSGQGWR